MTQQPRSRPDCYACRHQVPIPGDTHSECRHPAAGIVAALNFLAAAYSAERENPLPDVVQVKVGDPPIEIGFRMAGIQGGWATWPLNYDPTWLATCGGFTAKEIPDAG